MVDFKFPSALHEGTMSLTLHVGHTKETRLHFNTQKPSYMRLHLTSGNKCCGYTLFYITCTFDVLTVSNVLMSDNVM